MEIIKLTKDKYEEWDKFCLASDDAWFWHTSGWIEYTLNYRPELKTQNLSFLVYKEDKIVAIVPLTLEIYKFAKKNICEFSFGGGAIPGLALNSALLSAERELIYKLIFTEIDQLARQNKIVRSRFRLTPLSLNFLNNEHSFNYLMKFGYIDVSLNTQLIDFNRTNEELWNDLRRNHRRNIKKGKDFKINVYTSKNITKDIFNIYKEMHRKASGRKTRPDITFEMMHDWLTKDLAFLAAVEFKGKQVGFEYYSIYKNSVYGFSAANDPDYGYLPIRHFLEWEAILWMTKQGYSFYEIGLQQYGALLYDFPDKKQLDISHFKKGFGGFTVPWFMGERYYDKKYFLDISKKRIRRYANYLNGAQKI